MAEATLHKILEGHTSAVQCVAFSPDCKLLASCSWDSTVRLWNIPSGDLNAELKGHEYGVLSVAFSPDGKSIVTGSYDDTVRTWSVATKQQVLILNGHSDMVNSVLWSPFGDVIASGSEHDPVFLWDAISGSVKQKLTGHTDRVVSFSFSQNGKKLVSAGCDKIAIIWDVNSGATLITLAHLSYILSVCFSDDDQFVVTGCYDKIAHMFDASNGREEKQFEGHTDGVNSVACSFDGSTIASGGGESVCSGRPGDDFSVRLWDIASTKQLQKLDGHTKMVTSVSFSRDGKFIASASEDQTIRLWNTPSSLQSEMEAQQQLEVEQEIDMNSLRECVCCQEIKDSSYLLPCLHPTCSRCVEDMVQEANQKKRKRPSCVNCGETFVQDKLTTVPSATLLTPTCFDCNEPATHYCGECKNNMCKLHDGHFNSKRFQDHVVRLIAEVPFCHKHSTETALGLCTHCKVLICGPCGFTEHNKFPHLSVTFQEAVKTTADSLKSDIAELLEFGPLINKKIKKHKNIRARLEKEHSKTADVRNQEKLASLHIDDLENTKVLLLITHKQANTLAATAATLPQSTLVRLQSVVTSRVAQLQTGLRLISLLH